MEKLDIKKLKRDPDYIKSNIKIDGETMIAKKKMTVIFPNKFVDKELSFLDNVCNILGVVAIVCDNKFSVLTIPVRFDITPNEIIDYEIENEHYIGLEIEPNNVIIENINVIKNADLVFPIFDLFFMQGKVPWYLTYIDLYKVSANMYKYTGSKATLNTSTFELLVAITARVKDNPDKEVREIIKSYSEAEKLHPSWIGLTNIYYSFRSTLAKIAGAYFKKGIIASVVKPEKSVTDVEYVLRK